MQPIWWASNHLLSFFQIAWQYKTSLEFVGLRASVYFIECCICFYICVSLSNRWRDNCKMNKWKWWSFMSIDRVLRPSQHDFLDLSRPGQCKFILFFRKSDFSERPKMFRWNYVSCLLIQGDTWKYSLRTHYRWYFWWVTSGSCLKTDKKNYT